MGFSRLFYLLKRILYKIPKKILVYILIFIILMLFTTSSHASQVDVNNIPNADVRQYLEEIYRQDFYQLLYSSIRYAKNNNNTFHPTFVYFCNCVTVDSSRFYWFVSDEYSNSFFFDRNKQPISNNTDNQICFGVISEESCVFDYDDYFVLPGSRNSTYASGKQWALCTPSDSSISYRLNILTSTTSSISYTNNLQGYMYIPLGFEKYCPSELYDMIYSIAMNNFDFNSSNEILQDISEKIDETNIQLQSTNEFLNDDTTPTITSSDIPSIDLNDPTTDTFNRIFTRLYDATTTTNVEEVNIEMPFLDYTLTLRSDYLSSQLSRIHLDVLTDYIPSVYNATMLTLIYVFWRFYIYKYIVLDVYRIINEIRNGNIDNTEENIKADML